MAAVILLPAFFAAIFISLQPLASGDNFLAPFFSPIVDDTCEASLCGKGTCKVSPNLNDSFPLTCECEPGWKRLIQTYSFQFLPCVIPNCTVNYDCNNVTAPPPEASQPHNQSWFSHEACEFVYCGEGSCLKTNDGHKCVCNSGAYNLLNATHLPCYRECFLGADCAAMGFGLGNSPPDNFLAPFYSPIVDDTCEASLCGKGTCKVSPNLNDSFPLTCECEPGWKRLIQTYSFQFLPCVIPNCTVNYDCNNVTAPPPEASQAHNQSWFSHEACEFVYCGEGSCLKTNDGHKCVCNNGAYNLLNATHLPCYRECFLGANCAAMGFGLGNSPPGVSSRTSPGLSDSTSSATNTQGRSGSSRDLLWLFASVSILVVTPWM